MRRFRAAAGAKLVRLLAKHARERRRGLASDRLPREDSLSTYFHDPHQRVRKQLLPGVQIRTFWGDRMLLSLVDLEKNAEVPLHTHPHEQAGIVLQGEAEMTIGNETRQLKQGDVYVVPGDTVHAVKNRAKPACFLDIFSPVREEYKY
ncbi:MAG: cupin domain-containing protein [SAR202 cluster bacterium]|nr:cupin domain-containing protein [SAR202 cluster bacterium]